MNSESKQPFPSIPGHAISRLIGSGGMADVFLGTQLSLSRAVAIKVLAAEGAHGDVNVARFEQEARTIARLDHPDIVSIYDVGHTTDGRLYYTMPYLAHGDLGARDLSGDEAAIIGVVRAICRALAYAHQLGIVHRDVKPGNILFDSLDRPLLADFGIALSADHARVTREGSTIGSSGYSSPEQARGKALDGRADIYSLGVVAYELLSGDLPFHGPDTLSMALAHVEQPVPRLSPRLRRWQAFVDKAMAKNPADRFQSADEMQTALDAIDAERIAAAARPAVAARAARLRALAAAALILLGAAALAAGLMRWRESPSANAGGESQPPAVAEQAAAPMTASEPAADSSTAPAGESAPASAQPTSAAPDESAAPAARDVENLEFVFVPAQRDAAEGFWFAKYEVTRADYAAFAQATGRAASACREPLQPLSRLRKLTWRAPGFTQGDTHPVVCVSWNDASAYAQWLSQRTGATYRLPSRSQWLLAARAMPKGSSNCAQGNLGGRGRLPFHLGGGSACRGSADHTVAIGHFQANSLGIHDLVGNVSEWLQDCKRGSIDASGRCSERMFNGASWREGADADNFAIVGDADPDVGYTTVGIRLIRPADVDVTPAH